MSSYPIFAKNDQEKVKDNVKPDGSVDRLVFYSDPALRAEASENRSGGQDHDHIVFTPDGDVRYDSTQETNKS